MINLGLFVMHAVWHYLCASWGNCYHCYYYLDKESVLRRSLCWGVCERLRRLRHRRGRNGVPRGSPWRRLPRWCGRFWMPRSWPIVRWELVRELRGFGERCCCCRRWSVLHFCRQSVAGVNGRRRREWNNRVWVVGGGSGCLPPPLICVSNWRARCMCNCADGECYKVDCFNFQIIFPIQCYYILCYEILGTICRTWFWPDWVLEAL